MHVGIHLSNHLMAEALYQLLVKYGYDHVVTIERSPTNGLTPDVLLVDITTLSHGLLTQYPEAKVLLIDTGIEQDKLCATLLKYRIHGILSPHTELHLFKKAIEAVGQGQIWIDNGSVKAVLHNQGDRLSERSYQRPGTGGHRVRLPGVEQQRDSGEARPLTPHGKSPSQQNFQKIEHHQQGKAHDADHACP